MCRVSFDGIGARTATFACEDGVKDGQVVKVVGPGRVGACAAGDRPCGVAHSARNGFAAVQVGGFAAVAVSGSVSEGWTALEADGLGGMKQAEKDGTVYLVAEADGGSAVLML